VEDDGYLSITAWLVHRLGVPASVARSQVRLARALERMPGTAAALAEGEIPLASAHLLTDAHAADPERFEPSEQALLKLARSLPVRDLHRAIEHWRQLADAASADAAAERRFCRRGLYVSPTLEGMVRLDGELDPESGQTIISAIGAVVDASARQGTTDLRSPAQRRADALREICRRSLDSSDRPVVAGERPHVVVSVDLRALLGTGGRAELGDAGLLPPQAARRMACDAEISRVITRGPSEPLELGRRTPVVPASLCRAVVARDRRCRFPGCGRPQAWCDCHHVVHWADGGETSLSNLVLLCRPHHRMVHGRFGLEMVDGRPVFARTTGRCWRIERRRSATGLSGRAHGRIGVGPTAVSRVASAFRAERGRRLSRP
jgi:Domain of unknown function (DUF222)/HNH endonuclease